MAGSSDYPLSVDNKTALVDGVDYVEADDVNNSYVPLTATQTFIGSNGKGASWSNDVLGHLMNQQVPVCKKASGSTITVVAGTIAIKNSGQTNRLLRRNIADVTLTSSDLDTGAMAIGYYYIYAVADTAATTFTCKFSASETSPTGLTNFEMIGWFYNESGGALDITTGFVGNVRNGRGVMNILTLVDTTDTSSSSTSYANMPPTVKFYAPSKRIKVTLNYKWYDATNANYGAVTLNIDSSDISNCERWICNITSGVIGSSGREYGIPIEYIGTVAAAQTTIISRIKAGNAAYANHVVQKWITIEELEAA